MEDDELAARRRARRKKAGWKRPRRIYSLWARLGMAGVMIVASVFLGVILVAKIAKPYREAGLQSSQLLETRQQCDALASENALLARRIMYLKTPDGVASEARRLGYLRPGEIPMVVEGSAASSEGRSDYFAPKQLPSRSGNAARRFWQHLTGE